MRFLPHTDSHPEMSVIAMSERRPADRAKRRAAGRREAANDATPDMQRPTATRKMGRGKGEEEEDEEQ